MLLNLGLLLLFAMFFAYILVPPIFTKAAYLDAVRARYRKVFGGELTRRKIIIYELGAALIIICLVILLTLLTR